MKNLNKLANEWWSPGGYLKALHSMNQLRVPFIRDGLISSGSVPKENINTAHVLKGLEILEVGCGGGILTEPLARLRANMTGLDPAEDLLRVAKEHISRNEELSKRIIYRSETIESHSCQNVGRYDAVIASEVLEHVNDKPSFLESCVLALKPGGSIFITTINKTNLSWLGGVVAAENILKLVPKDTHDWEKFISPEEIERILQDFNCTTVLVHGMAYKFWIDEWEWSQFKDINFVLHATKD